ncbi:MAG TPA: hypothetical protein VEY11_03980 [Pyrinomonadaceae bacterium]|nr:hypothetical protein [Pyrinomonadaceae bacterium]
MKRNITGKMICLLVLFVAAVFVGADLPVSAQNTNSGNTGDSMMMQQNTNTGMMSARRGRRRARRQARRTRRRARRNANAGAMDANANMTGDMSGNTNMSGDTSGMQDANMNMSGGGQGGNMAGMGTFGDVADLSGTYTGTINYAEGGMTGEATLTITSNTFTITSGAATASGTLSARSWPGYTALSMRFGDTLPATIISTRAWHRGRTLRIQSVRGESRAFTFNGRSDAAGGDGSGGAMEADAGGMTTRARGRRGRGRRGRRSAPAMMTPPADETPTPTPGQ